MRQVIFAALASVVSLGALATPSAEAQAVPPVGSGVSPYLNLFQRGNPNLNVGTNLAINYYGLTRPQLQYNAAISNLQQQVTATRVATNAAENQAVPQTGHPIAFLNYKNYFLNTGVSSPFANVQASQRAIGAGSLPTGTGAGVPGTRSSLGYGGGSGGYGIGSSGSIGSGSFRRY